MMIEPDFANGDNPRVFGELTQLLEAIGRCFHGMIRMNPDDREDVRMRVGNGQCATASFDGRSDGDDPRDAGRVCALDELGRLLVARVEVRVRVGHAVAAASMRASSSATTRSGSSFAKRGAGSRSVWPGASVLGSQRPTQLA